VSGARLRLAFAAGRWAARRGLPLTVCPWSPTADPLLVLWFVRGYRAVETGS
jgi:hypothetical protein